jgi:RNA polymerase sigma-B factor
MRDRVQPAEDPEVLELFARAHDDPDARDELVLRFLPMARSIARRFVGRGESEEDLQQVAMVGLVCAIDRYEPDRDVRFATYAVSVIAGELKRHLRDRAWDVHVPRPIKETALRVSRSLPAMVQSLGRIPTTNEIADNLELESQEVVEAVGALRAYTATPIDRPGVVRQLEVPADEEQELFERWSDVAPLLRQLPMRERVILYMRYFEGRTQAEIASELGLSQMHISRTLGRTLDLLRERASA